MTLRSCKFWPDFDDLPYLPQPDPGQYAAALHLASRSARRQRGETDVSIGAPCGRLGCRPDRAVQRASRGKAVRTLNCCCSWVSTRMVRVWLGYRVDEYGVAGVDVVQRRWCLLAGESETAYKYVSTASRQGIVDVQLSTSDFDLSHSTHDIVALPGSSRVPTSPPAVQPTSPPALPGVPFLGNLPSIPLVKSYVKFAEWTRQYGPILGLKAGPLNLVVLQDPADVHELFEVRGQKYAGRPYNYIALNHVYEPDIGQILLFQRNDKLLKRWKRPARWFLSQQGIEAIMPIVNAMSSRCVKSLMDKPADFVEHLRIWSLGTPIVALSGQSDVSPELLRTYFYRQKLLTGLLEPGKTPPVDFVVPLRWVPAWLARWKRDARFVRQHQDAFYGDMVAKASALVQHRRRGGKAGEYDAVMVRLLEEGMGEREVKWLAGGLLDAAFDTSSAAVMNFLVAMAGHGEVLRMAKEEVERECEGRVPQGEDVGRLKYLRACMMETFRWRPPAPLGLPHVLDSDDTYKDYLLPRGTNVLVNAFGMLHDPLVHANPDVFDPSRYLDAATHADDARRSTWVFGAGRRKCAGDAYMMQALMTVMAKMVWGLDMVLAEGTDLSVEGGFDGGLMLKPKEGTVVEFKVREGRKGDIERDWERGESELERLLGKAMVEENGQLEEGTKEKSTRSFLEGTDILLFSKGE
ncbi:hypothetical protein G7046_g9813 [Stylonectria norvegica]|nr:hypothetical protein G7046_g9813 [Stylonectria norvegica]